MIRIDVWWWLIQNQKHKTSFTRRIRFFLSFFFSFKLQSFVWTTSIMLGHYVIWYFGTCMEYTYRMHIYAAIMTMIIIIKSQNMGDTSRLILSMHDKIYCIFQLCMHDRTMVVKKCHQMVKVDHKGTYPPTWARNQSTNGNHKIRFICFFYPRRRKTRRRKKSTNDKP